MSSTKLLCRLPIIIFFVMALLPTFFFGLDGPAVGTDIVPPSTAEFPSHVSQQFLKDLGQWFGRHVGFRLLLRYIGLQYHLVLLRWPIAPEVAFGRDGWLFYSDDQDTGARMHDFRGMLRFPPDRISKIESSLRTTHDALAACAITFLVVIVPNKQSIYGQFLGGDEATVRTRLDDMLDHLDASVRSTILDLRQPLRAAALRVTPQVLYRRTDTHWNDLGAYVAYRAVLNRLTSPEKQIDSTPLGKFTIEVRPSRGGDIARMLLAPDLFPDIDLTVRLPTEPSNIESRQTGSGMFVFRRTANDRDGRQVLLFGDSFAPSLAMLLARHFGTVYVRPPSIDVQEIGQLKPDIVIFETVARYEERLVAPMAHIEQACARRPHG